MVVSREEKCYLKKQSKTRTEFITTLLRKCNGHRIFNFRYMANFSWNMLSQFWAMELLYTWADVVRMYFIVGIPGDTEVIAEHYNSLKKQHSAYPSWLRADGGILCRCCCCQPVTEPRWRALAVLNPERDDISALLREYSRIENRKENN